LDFLFGQLGKETCFDHKRNFGETSFAQDFEDTVLGAVQDGCFTGRFGLFQHIIAQHGPKLVDVGDRAKGLIAFKVVVTHTDFTEVTRVKLIKQSTVMVLTTSVTTTPWVRTMFTDTTVTGRDVTSLFTIFV
jgi:hypothetical protein